MRIGSGINKELVELMGIIVGDHGIELGIDNYIGVSETEGVPQ